MTEKHSQSGTQHSLDREPHQEKHAATTQAPPSSVEAVAPQDPQAQGAASAEQNTMLHANVSGSKQKGAAEVADDLQKEQPGGTAGVHSTGSHTGTSHSHTGTSQK